MKKLLLILVALVCTTLVFPQNEASNWYFGYGAGLKFNPLNGTVTSVDDGRLSTDEGCASISDSDGNLLFYTDGSTVYNRNHEIMLDGLGLFGDASSSQSALIVPKPQDPNIYYIFTVDVAAVDGTDFGFNYSIVDMTLDGGLGAITDKNVNLLNNCSEKLSAVLKDCETQSIWVITFAAADGVSAIFNTYHAFEVNSTGVVTNSVKSTFPISIEDVRGYMKLSPDGTKMASANMRVAFQQIPDYTNSLLLYDFDASTGLVSNQQPLQLPISTPAAYGIEFSPDSRFLYVHSSNNAPASALTDSHLSTLTQFDLEAPDIQASQVNLDQRTLYRGALQLGPDGKIYRALAPYYEGGYPYLGVIHNPNELGAASNYEHNAISLAPNRSSQGLPPFIQSFFDEQIDIIQNGISTQYLNLCLGETYTLLAEDIPGATYIWTMDGNPLPETDFDLDITGPGHYEVFIDLNTGECQYKEGQAYVSYFEVPIANSASDVNGCDTDYDGVLSFDFASTSSEILGAQNPSTFAVNYFASQADADANQNKLALPFENTSNPQQIFARIENVGYSGCFEITSFMRYGPLFKIRERLLEPVGEARNDFLILTELAELEQLIYAAHYDGDAANGSPRTGWVKVGLIADLSMLTSPSAEAQASALKQTWSATWNTYATDRGAVDKLVADIDAMRGRIKDVVRNLD